MRRGSHSVGLGTALKERYRIEDLVGVLRLRSCFASRSSYYAQDDWSARVIVPKLGHCHSRTSFDPPRTLQ